MPRVFFPAVEEVNTAKIGSVLFVNFNVGGGLCPALTPEARHFQENGRGALPYKGVCR